MDDQRQARLPRHRDVGAEQGSLGRAVGVVVVIIEPGFANRNNPGMFGRGEQDTLTQIGMVIGLMRVDADAGPYVRLASRRCDDLIPLALAGRDIEKATDACRAGA